MALSLDDAKKRKPLVSKKSDSSEFNKVEVRQKIPPYKSIDESRPVSEPLLNAHISPTLDASATPSNDMAHSNLEHLSETDLQTSNKLVTDASESSNKLTTQQHKSSNKLVTTFPIIENLDTDKTQTSNKLVTDASESSNKTHNRTSNKLVTNETDDTSGKRRIVSFNELSGLRKKIVNHIFDLSFRNINSNKSRNTGPLTKEQLVEITGTSANVIHVTLHRLIKENIIIKNGSKEGRGGYLILSLSESIYEEVLFASIHGNYKQTSNKLITEPITELVTNPPSKLVSNINNNLTNSLETKIEKPTWFKDLNFVAVQPISPMQVNSSIRDLVQERLSPEIVQEFLNKFKSWLAQQSRIQNPLAMFCEKLKELAVEGDSAILACMTEEERLIEVEFAQQIEKARLEMALIAKSKEHSAKQEFETKFETWYAQTSRNEHELLQASTSLIEYGSEIYKNVLRQKFREQQEG